MYSENFFIRSYELFIEFGKPLSEGIRNTVLLAFFAVLLGTLLGIFIALGKLSSFPPFRWLSSLYIEVIRGIPLMVQLFLVFYGLPLIGIRFPDIGFVKDFPRFTAGVVALSINSAAYVAEIIRSGIQAVDHGQMEAARSIGLKKSLAMRTVIFPQAVRNILPALGNEFVVVIKESAIASVLGIADIMYRAGDVRSATFFVFEPYLMVAIIYLTLTFTTSKLVGLLERRMSKSVRR